ncbi:SAP domain-containing protein [Meloidogyne graminicola]|uniref:SAP domain-containing protein n=1 Tax=Meloidogyne graminicola TaxID=189291 RepID=A0A8S9ZKR6_9BILA|nr:SAP domain-containing protein [Meloidogyne graminicola]
MEVEVECHAGYFFNGIVDKIVDDDFHVIYENGWLKPERVKMRRCRAMIDSSCNKENKQQFKRNDSNGRVCVVDNGRTIKEYVPIIYCRHIDLLAKITKDLIYGCVFSVDGSIDLLKGSEGDRYKLLYDTKILHYFVPGIFLKLERKPKKLEIKAFSQSIIETVKRMEEPFLLYIQGKISLIDFFKHVQILSEPNIVERILSDDSVENKLMQTTITLLCPHIDAARKLPGIMDIIPSSNNPHRKFKIYANDYEAVEKANSVLGVVRCTKPIPLVVIKHIVGEGGETIKKIMDLSQVLHLDIGNVHEERVPFIFNGTLGANNFACLTIDLILNKLIDPPFISLEHCKEWTPLEFLSASKKYFSQNPPDLVQTASKLWFSAAYSIIILINLASHSCLRIFCQFAVDESSIKRKAYLYGCWSSAEKCHSYTYGSNYIDKSTYLKWMKEVEYFVKNFIQIKPEDIDAENLEEFLDNSEGFKVNKEEGSKINLYFYIIFTQNVVQLREKLKSRKLPVTGSKSELVNRLFDSLMVEEKLLEEGPGGENIDLSGVNMDEVLGLDDDKDTHSSPNATNDGEELDNKNEVEEEVKEILSKEIKINEDKELTKSKGTIGEDKSKMLKCAERCGLPLKRSGGGTSESEMNDILAKREKRFGTGNVGFISFLFSSPHVLSANSNYFSHRELQSNSTGKYIKIITKKDEDEAKEKRAARFGLTDSTKRKGTTDDDSKMLKRAERFGLPLKRDGGGGGESSESEIIAKRVQRFGPVVGSGDIDTKKEARIKHLFNFYWLKINFRKFFYLNYDLLKKHILEKTKYIV